MSDPQALDVVIVGGSYAGLAAGLALGRALRRVLIIDNGQSCNRQTPYSHNFLTQDGVPPKEIAALAKRQLERYASVECFDGLATSGFQTETGFNIQVASGLTFSASKLIFASGIRDRLPTIAGVAQCWGISVLHCPYCHGYEVSNEKTGILGTGKRGTSWSGSLPIGPMT
jgi:thioredoxin reductase